MFKYDLHIHTSYSGDTDADPEECIVRAIERGLDGVAFTEHYSYDASEFVERLREKYADVLLVLRGVEFSAAEGHCLVFGVNTDRLSLRYAPIEHLISVVSREGGVVIPSHPYRGANSLGDLCITLPGITAIEGYNGCNHHAFNERAVEKATARSIPFTGGSDAHTPREVGSCYTVFRQRVTSQNFIGLLRQGEYFGKDTRKVSKLLF